MSEAVQMYYLMDARTCTGNCATWWAPGGNGYVCDLDKAGKFTKEQAFGRRDTDVPVPCEVADAAVVKHVRVDTPAMEAYWGAPHARHMRSIAGPRTKKGNRP